MRFATLSKAVSFLLAGLGLLSLSFGGELSPVSLICLLVGFVAAFFAEGPRLASQGWSRFVTAAVFGLLGVQLLRGAAGDNGWLALAMEFAGWLTISRLANRRSAQDDQQIAMLAFIELIAATVLTTDLAYAGLFLAFVIVTPWALTLSHLRAEIERNYPVESELRGGTDLHRVLASRRIVGPSFLLWTSLLSLPMLLMTLLLFVAFPRVGLGFVSLSAQRGQHTAGFGSDVSLGGFGMIRDDPTVVLRVSAGRPLTFAEQNRFLRLRGTAFDHYDGRRWTRSRAEPVRMSSLSGYYPLRRVEMPGDLTLKIVLERLDEPVLFLPTGSVGLRIPMRGIPGVARHQIGVLRNHGLDLRYDSADELGVVYDAIVSRQAEDDDVPVARDTDDGRYLQMPKGHERVAALARRLTADLRDPVEIAARLEGHLRDHNRFKYSLSQPDTKNRVPLDVFLFDAKRGHCEYFATALAIMLRSLGIPSRNVTGFVGGTYNSYGGYYSLRQGDAHSWVEALISERGWITLDPTPPSHERSARSSLFADANAMIDALRAYWMTRVVGYDLRTQIRGVRTFSAMWRKLSSAGFSFGGKDGQRADKPGRASSNPLLSFGIVALLLVVGLAAGAWALSRFLRRRAERQLGASALAARKLYRELERLLEKQGRGRPKHVTAEAHARSLVDQGFAASGALLELTDSYVAARYGERELDHARLRALRKLLTEVKRAA
jgi:transglutaminase-like putative cysteine protease